MYTNSAWELKISVAQPLTKPGSLVNHSNTSKMKRHRTLISPKDIGPSRRCCSRITLYAAISFSVFTAPQPHVFLKLEDHMGRKVFVSLLHSLTGLVR